MTRPMDFPTRSEKPRRSGRTNILDKGIGLGHLRDLLAVAGRFIDVAKIGWGTGLVLNDLQERIALYREFDVQPCFGGTMFEFAVISDQLDRFVAWNKDLGIDLVEVSDGTIEIDESEKIRYIEKLTSDFTVLSEVGSKDAAAIVSPARWVRAITSELQAGASGVILEGRESGTAGLYRGSGELRMGLIDEVLESGIDPNLLYFETPSKAHQVYMIKLLGADVNLANIAPDDAIPLETLRRGLRSDTLLFVHDS